MNAIGLNATGLFLLELTLKGALLLTAAFALAFLLQRASAATRHAVWGLAFAGLLLLPVCAVFLPAWSISMPSSSGLDGWLPEAAAPIPVEAPGPVLAVEPLLERPMASNASAAHGVVAARTVSLAPPGPFSWTGLALFVWIGGVLLLLVRLAIVLGRLSVLRRGAEPVTDPEWIELAEVLTEVLDIRRPVRLLRHTEIVVPMTYGVRRPVILLPAHADAWSEDQKHVTLMHELLHVQRCDHLVHLLALTARAVHWFNPLAWAATKQLLVERERACDDGVLAMGVASTSYADHLVGLARYVLTGRETSSGALAMARSSELRSRVLAILDPGQPRHALTRERAFGLGGGALLLMLPFAALQPTGSADPAPAPAALARPFEAAAGPETGVSGFLTKLGNLVFAPAIQAVPEPASLAEEAAAVDTSDLETQRRALHAIAQLPPERSIPLLTDIARTHRHPEIRADAVFWLGQEGDASVAELLESFARNDASEEVQRKAIFSLSELNGEAGVARLVNLARTHQNVELRAEAVFWIAQAGGPDVVDLLAGFAQNDDPEVRQKAVFALSEVPNGAGLPRLMDLARTHPDDELRAEAVFWLGQEGGTEVADALEAFVRNDESSEVRKKALFALAELEDNAGVPRLIDLAKSHPDAELRAEAVFWLGESGDPRAADLLMKIVQGE